MRILILEDSPERLILMKEALEHVSGLVLTHVETTNEAISKLYQEEFDIVSLDHDLGGEVMVKSGVGTGYEVAEWLANNPERQPPQIWLHSLNPVGLTNMGRVLPNAIKCPQWWIS